MLLAMLSLLQVQAFVGGDRDGHGCCGSCGYHYSNTCSKCMHVSCPTKTCPLKQPLLLLRSWLLLRVAQRKPVHRRAPDRSRVWEEPECDDSKQKPAGQAKCDEMKGWPAARRPPPAAHRPRMQWSPPLSSAALDGVDDNVIGWQ